jgi:hypothetical protein
VFYWADRTHQIQASASPHESAIGRTARCLSIQYAANAIVLMIA